MLRIGRALIGAGFFHLACVLGLLLAVAGADAVKAQDSGFTIGTPHAGNFYACLDQQVMINIAETDVKDHSKAIDLYNQNRFLCIGASGVIVPQQVVWHREVKPGGDILKVIRAVSHADPSKVYWIITYRPVVGWTPGVSFDGGTLLQLASEGSRLIAENPPLKAKAPIKVDVVLCDTAEAAREILTASANDGFDAAFRTYQRWTKTANALGEPHCGRYTGIAVPIQSFDRFPGLKGNDGKTLADHHIVAVAVLVGNQAYPGFMISDRPVGGEAPGQGA